MRRSSIAQRFVRPAAAVLIAVLTVSAIPSAGSAQEGVEESAGGASEVDVRIVARRLDDGRVEFGLQQRDADGSWGERLLPSRRFFPATAGVGPWLASSTLTVTVPAPAASPSETPQVPPPEPGAALVAAGSFHTCAINARGGVDCWGDNPFGLRIGDPSIHQARSPVPVRGLTDAVAVSVGGSASGGLSGPTCVVHRDRSVSCWGSDTHGVLGQGTPGPPPTPQDAGSEGDPTDPGVAYLTGSAEPIKVPGITDAVEVAVGSRHVCVLHSDGGVSCWGSNRSGALGDGTRQSRNWPYRIPTLRGVVAIGAGDWHSCAVHADGARFCAGATIVTGNSASAT
ncbi:MAG: hypothetical protein OXG91_13940, partial [bacterium]|nr:hypothetical protein [bacterium]